MQLPLPLWKLICNFVISTLIDMRKKPFTLLLLLAVISVSFVSSDREPLSHSANIRLHSTTLFDIIIENGRVIDGTGNPWFRADIGIIDDRIHYLGALGSARAKRRIDASGMFVTPGFIDIHTHSNTGIINIPQAENSLQQGLTTIVAGNCGGAPLPVGEFLNRVSEKGISINYATLTGHNSIRSAVMGSANRPPTAAEMSEMKALVEKSMLEGAFGLSTGLFYTPGNYAETSEIIELAKVAANYNGMYVSHLRDESDYSVGLIEAVKEAIMIGEEAGIRVQISHLKCLGKPVWNKSQEVLQLIEEARDRGLDIRFDQYPYTASATNMWSAIFPAWAREGGNVTSLERLESSELGDKLRAEMRDNIERRGGASTLYIVREKAFLSDLAAKWDCDPVEAAIRIQKNGSSTVISYNMTDHDLETILKSPYGMIGSDGSVGRQDNSGHPRSFGTFPRVLRLYVREKNLLTWEEAVRKMTSAPAERLGLWDRGIIRPGAFADIVVFDPLTVSDKATYESPTEYPEGILYVLVNGKTVIDNHVHTGLTPGKVLTNTR